MLVLLLLLCFNLLNAADESKQEVVDWTPEDVQELVNHMIDDLVARRELNIHILTSTSSGPADPSSIYRRRSAEEFSYLRDVVSDKALLEFRLLSPGSAAQIREDFRTFLNEAGPEFLRRGARIPQPGRPDVLDSSPLNESQFLATRPEGRHGRLVESAIREVVDPKGRGRLGNWNYGSPVARVRPVSPILAADDALVLPWDVLADIEDQVTDSEGEEANAPRIIPGTPEELIAAIMTPRIHEVIAAPRTPRTPRTPQQSPRLNVTPDFRHPRDEEDPAGQPPLKRARLEEVGAPLIDIRNFRRPPSPGDDYDDRNDGRLLSIQ